MCPARPTPRLGHPCLPPSTRCPIRPPPRPTDRGGSGKDLSVSRRQESSRNSGACVTSRGRPVVSSSSLSQSSGPSSLRRTSPGPPPLSTTVSWTETGSLPGSESVVRYFVLSFARPLSFESPLSFGPVFSQSLATGDVWSWGGRVWVRGVPSKR